MDRLPTIAPRTTPLRVIALMVCTVALLGAGEWWARSLTQSVDAERHVILDRAVGWRLRPSAEIAMPGWNERTQGLMFRTNRRGLRGARDYPAPKPTDQIRVLCLGDSNTNLGALDAWPERLQALMSQVFPEADVWVQNAGMAGYSSHQVRRLAEVEVPLFEPDWVVVMTGTQDVSRAQVSDAGRAGGRLGLGDLLALVGQRSSLVSWVRSAAPSAMVQPYRVMHVESGDVLRVSVEDLDANLVAVAQTAREHGAVPVTLVPAWLPTDVPPEHPHALENIRPHWRRMREVAERESVDLIDLVAAFDRPDQPALYLYRLMGEPGAEEPVIDPVHFSRAGSDLAALEIARLMVDQFAETAEAPVIDTQPIESLEAWFSLSPLPAGDELDGIAPPEVLASPAGSPEIGGAP